MCAPPPVAAPNTGSPSGNEKAAIKILKRLAAEVGLRDRGDDGHRKRPSLHVIEVELSKYVKRGFAASKADTADTGSGFLSS